MSRDTAAKGIFDDINSIKGEQTILHDALGVPFPVNEIDGFYYSPVVRFTLHEEMKTLKIRENDIIFCSYPRSGQHWMWNIVYRLTHDMNEAPNGYEAFCMPEMVSHGLDEVPSPRLIRTHQLPDSLPQDIWKKKCKVINIVRHPKDVSCSLYKHLSTWMAYEYDGTWQGFLPSFLKEEVPWNGWFKHVRAYSKKAEEADILLVTYEECKRDTLGTIRKLAKYIGVERSEKDYKQLVEDTRIESIQTRNVDYNAYSKGGRGSDVMFRQGKVGDWKNHFTEAQNEMFNNVYKDKLKDMTLLYDNILDS
ncbi:unnamed protein product [Owenia fusiformis]|uniref:Uncharacterized protein n=1 Tax=Owenia fusiformis TaxID=6347 RepID=A0A8J1U314_OWEFU|nr:unnamed protein product [Owenia fusiformis]